MVCGGKYVDQEQEGEPCAGTGTSTHNGERCIYFMNYVPEAVGGKVTSGDTNAWTRDRSQCTNSMECNSARGGLGAEGD